MIFGSIFYLGGKYVIVKGKGGKVSNLEECLDMYDTLGTLDWTFWEHYDEISTG